MTQPSPTTVSLNFMLADAGLPRLAEDVAITQVAYHTNQVQPGSLFCCLPGMLADGHEFAGQAQSQGAAALLCETPLGLGLPEIVVPSARVAMPQLAAAFYGHPSRYLSVVGVTGTNGKTSVVSMLGSIYRAAGQAAVTIGTLSQELTTPEAPDLQRELAAALEAGNQAVALEVSSHAIAQHRIDGIGFELCAFTNLSPEHLDYHETLEDYFQTKQSLFTAAHTHQAVVCVDDSFGQELFANLRGGLDAGSCSTAEVNIVSETLTGSLIEIDGQPIQLPIPGRLAIVNANIAAAIARKLELDSTAVRRGLELLPVIPGRFEVVREQPVAVVVDYAHSPQALEATLRSSRELAGEGASLHVVFGCGGERDPFKRFAMGKIASELADFSYLTSDNPRGEDPADIAADIAAGFETGRPGGQAHYLVELDRRLAIEKALRTAHEGDLVLVAGKGHETSQQLGDDVLEFDDRQVAGELADEIFAVRSGGGHT